MSEVSTQPFNPSVVAAHGSPDWAWPALLAAARAARTARAGEAGSFALGAGGSLRAVPRGAPDAVLERTRSGAWAAPRALPDDLEALFDLYLPVCAATPVAPLTIGHLGQSLDGYIATRGGDSSDINGPENILHLHRMRALCDAIVVGAGTIAADDPRLTTRLADGTNPVRVILDPQRRLRAERHVFSDGAAPSLVVCAAEHAAGGARLGCAELVGVPCADGRLDLGAVLAKLRERGLNSIFVEGGGTTVSRFLEAGLLDRLQIAVAPLVMGSGRPGLRLPAVERVAECLRPARRAFAMGADILFDCDLRHAVVERVGARAALARIY